MKEEKVMLRLYVWGGKGRFVKINEWQFKAKHPVLYEEIRRCLSENGWGDVK